jgi:hypothetical protein
LDKKEFSEVQNRLLEVNKVIVKLDSAIRNSAFEFLKPYISSGVLAQPDPRRTPNDQPHASDEAELIEKHADGKPSDIVNLLAAIWFSEYGSNPFSVGYIREKADSAGLTISDRVDKTLNSAKDKGKSLYVSAGRGLFRPTVLGEGFFKTTYGVKKGTKAPPSEK